MYILRKGEVKDVNLAYNSDHKKINERRENNASKERGVQ